ncbi:cytochrome c oxidase subunit 3 [Nocardia carnea]|uniref:cytochrome c oxidase subunit 3 n=1 Tax=Nocardia carnea TaxID=37328 RepID=UPI003D76ADE2
MTLSESASESETTAGPEPRPGPPDRPGRHLPGDIDMWVMVLGDLLFFGGYFVVYMVFRAFAPEEFATAQQHLHMGIGVTNTVVLLTSSMFVALAVIDTRRQAFASAQRYILAAAGCGLLFTALKAYEWHQEITGGHTLSDEFFSFYYILTGVHLVHVLLGVVILGIVYRELRNPAGRRISIAEQGALFWHMVDLLWVVIFAILYLM